MRLGVVAHGHRLRERLLLGLVGLGAGRVPDVLRALLYRPALFGRPFGDLLHAVMRGPSPWSVGERELFAAFVSHENQCPF